MFIKKPTSRIFTCCLAVLFAGLLTLSAHARQLGDITFADTVTLEATDTVIQLNGMGYRTKFFVKVYVAGLYLQEKVNTRDAAQAMSGPKRIVMHIVHDEISRKKIVNGWNEGFEQNNSDAQLQKLQSRLNVFNDYFGDLKAGDVILLDYIPGAGTRVTINNEEKGVIKGNDFYAAILDIWLGDEPADEDLKDALLSKEED